MDSGKDSARVLPRRRYGMRIVRFECVLAFTLAVCALTGCASLLPAASTDARAGFDSFEAAETALEQVVPYQTTIAEIQALGFDLAAGPNVTVITYPDVIARLAPNAGVPLDAMEPGICDCILARTTCQAYEFQIARQRRQREGGFWLDFLNFRRTTLVTGWRFDALIVVRDGVVLFRKFGGERQISRLERQTNPLGPLQGAGEIAAGNLVKK